MTQRWERVVAMGVVAAVVMSALCMAHDIVGTEAFRPPVQRAPRVRALEPLREAANKRGIYAGAAANCGDLHNAPDRVAYNSTLHTQYDLITAENSCKFGPTEPERGQFNFTCCDFMRGIAESMGGVMRLHNLCWGNSNPSWLLDGKFNESELEDILTTHVTTLIKRYAVFSNVIAVDVVNEAIADGGSSAPMFKPNVWYPAVPNYVELAFKAAAAARNAVDSNIKLFYNDYSIHDPNPKVDRVISMVKDFQAANTPIDGIGIQLHVSTDSPPTVDGLTAVMQSFSALGLEVHITELDIACTPAPCDAAHLETQAKIYGDVVTACLAVPACKSFETWGFTDKYTWLWTYNNPNHTNMMPLPFDETYAPKPAVTSILAAFNA